MEPKNPSFWTVNKEKIKLFLISASIGVFALLSFLCLMAPGLVSGNQEYRLVEVTFGGTSGPVVFSPNYFLIISFILIVIGFMSSMRPNIKPIFFLINGIVFIISSILLFLIIPLNNFIQPAPFTSANMGYGAIIAAIILFISACAEIALYIFEKRTCKSRVTIND